jgi:DNA-binding HxlR family transcriptional regulator
MSNRDYREQDCALARALEAIGERWVLLIIRDAFYGVRNFNDFRMHLDIPKAVLTERLTSLVNEDILRREPDPTHAGRHLYELTQTGRDLWPAVHALLSWGSEHRSINRLAFKHVACGTELTSCGDCPTCEVAPPPGDVMLEPRPGAKSRRQDPVAIALRGPHRLLEPLLPRDAPPAD